MHIPPSWPSSLDTSLNQIDSQFFPLSREQIARARWLGISNDRLREIQERNLASRLFLWTIRRHKRALAYLKYITQPVSPHGPILRKDILKEWSFDTIQDDITLLIEELFVERFTSKNIHLVAAYAVEDYREREWYLHMIWLLTFWKELGREHASYARLPKEGELRNKKEAPRDKKIYDEARVIWKDFTGRVVWNQLKGYTLSYELYAYDDAGKKVHQFLIKNEPLTSREQKVFVHAGRSPRKKGEKYSRAEIEYLEELFTIAGDVPLVYPPPIPLLADFIEEHEAYFKANPTQYTWDAGRQIIENLKTVVSVSQRWATEKPKKWPKNQHRPGRPEENPYRSSWASPWVPEKTLREKKFPKPEIFSGFQNILRWGNPYSESAKKTVPNLANDALLWIQTHDAPWVWQKYRQEDIVSILPLTAPTTFSFCFTQWDYGSDIPPDSSDVNPHVSITITPRITHSRPLPPPPSSNEITENVQVQVAAVVPIFSAPPPEEAPDRTDEVWLEILEIMERAPEGIIISSENPLAKRIYWVFHSHPVIHFIIDLDESTVRLGPTQLDWVNITRLEKDLSWAYPSFIEVVMRHRENLYLEHFSKIRNKLSYLLWILTREFEPSDDTEVIEIADILESTTINNRYGGDIFMNSLHRGKFEAIRALLEKEWLEISLVDDGITLGKNYSVAVTLDDGSGGKILYKISRIPESPYYAFSSKESGFSGKTDGYFRGIALDIYLILALIGKEIFSSQVWPSSITRRPYSEEQIAMILEGKFQHEKRIPWSFTPWEKTLIYQAAQRVKSWVLKISKWETTEYKSGLVIPNILTARSIMEFHALEESDEIVLVDTKFTCIDEERAQQIEENWQKKKKKRTHPYSSTYAILRNHDRSRKYIIHRMIATVKGEQFRALSPLSNRMGQFFWDFWESLPSEKRREFSEAVSGKWGHAGKWQKVILSDGRWLLDAFIELADKRKIPFLYSKPKTLSKRAIVEYIQSEDYKNWLATLTRERPDMGEVRWK